MLSNRFWSAVAVQTEKDRRYPIQNMYIPFFPFDIRSFALWTTIKIRVCNTNSESA